jgi:hypothetical protein
VKRNQRRPTPWRRKVHPPKPELLSIARELMRREFADLEDCRVAWAKASDPVALCVALTKVDLPQWLADALLVWLFAGGGSDAVEQMFPFREYWAARRAEAEDAQRAALVIAARGTDAQRPAQTWGEASGVAEQVVRKALETPAVGADAVRKTVDRVRVGLKNEGAYWKSDDGLGDRLRLALQRRAGRM